MVVVVVVVVVEVEVAVEAAAKERRQQIKDQVVRSRRLAAVTTIGLAAARKVHASQQVTVGSVAVSV